jgi:hypothetical protein
VTTALSTGRAFDKATLLPDGRVLVFGGRGPGNEDLVSVEIYDPALGVWVPTNSMSVGRQYHVATVLADGRVLVSGGNTLRSTETYDPALGTWSLTGSMNVGRSGHTATLLADGRVAVSGGVCDCCDCIETGVTASAEVYDRVVGTWFSTGERASGIPHSDAALRWTCAGKRLNE